MLEVLLLVVVAMSGSHRYAPDAEVGVVGAMLIDQAAIAKASSVVSPSMFGRAEHRAIIEAAVALDRAGQDVDVLTVAEHLRGTDELDAAGGLDYLGSLVDAVPSADHVESHARLVRRKYELRRVEDGTTAALRSLEEGEGLDGVLEELRQIADHGSSSVGDLPTLAASWTGSLDRYLEDDPYLLRMSRIGMGAPLDRMMGGGLSPGQIMALVALGAGQGKTAFLHQLVDSQAVTNALAVEYDEEPVVVPIIFVSELSERDLTLRSLARQAGVGGYILRDPKGSAGSQHLAGGVTVGEDALKLARRSAEDFRAAAGFITVRDRRSRVTLDAITQDVRAARRKWEERDCTVPTVLVVLDPIHRLLDLTMSEVEALGVILPKCLDLAHREQVVVAFTSDTTKSAASSRKSAGGIGRGEDLAHLFEMAFRSNYQLIHHADVALGMVALREDDPNLHPDAAERLSREPDGTRYAEVVNAKARYDEPGRQAAFYLDPAMFRFRPTTPRRLSSEVSIDELVLEFVASHPGDSENAVRKGVKGKDTSIRKAVRDHLSSGRIVDRGDNRTGRQLYIAETPRGTGREQPREQPREQVDGHEAVPGGSSIGREPPTGTTPPHAHEAELDEGQQELGVEGTR